MMIILEFLIFFSLIALINSFLKKIFPSKNPTMVAFTLALIIIFLLEGLVFRPARKESAYIQTSNEVLV